MKNHQKIKQFNKLRRHKRARAKILGTAKVPRLCIYKSLRDVYAQLIDDEKRVTLASASTKSIKTKKQKGTEPAFEMGKIISEKALKKNIKSVKFDKGGFKYHGKVKAVAEGARQGGLKF